MRTIYAALAATGFVMLTTAAQAGVTLVSGAGNLITNPSDMKYTANAYQDLAAKVNFWQEQEAYTLSSNLVVSMLPPASFPFTNTSHFNVNTNVISSGTKVASYYFYFDPKNTLDIEATFKFTNKVLGIVSNERNNAANDHFERSDYLIPGAVPVGNKVTGWFEARGLEISDTVDTVRWINDRELKFSWRASSPGDQLRVITAVPEPATLATLVIGAAAMMRRRQRA